MRLQSAVQCLVVESKLGVSAALVQYALCVPKIEVFYTKLGVLDFNSSVDAWNFPNSIGGVRIHIVLVSYEQNSC